MPTPTAEPNLRHAILAGREDHAWWSTPAARLVLDSVLELLTPLALRVGADPADALSYAFEVWLTFDDELLADEAADLWAYTCTAVRHALAREQEAARKVTSATAVRRTSTRAAAGVTSLDDNDLAADEVEYVEVSVSDPRLVRAKAALDQVLTMAGFDEDGRLIVIDVLSDSLEGSLSARASIARAERVHTVVGAHLTGEQWRTLVEIILGTPAGLPGVVQLAAAGHPAPAVEPHISSRLLTLISAVAA